MIVLASTPRATIPALIRSGRDCTSVYTGKVLIVDSSSPDVAG